MFCAVALCLFVLQRKIDSDMLVYVLWLFWPLRMFSLICLPLQFRYKVSRRMKKKKKKKKRHEKKRLSADQRLSSAWTPVQPHDFAARWARNNHSFCMQSGKTMIRLRRYAGWFLLGTFNFVRKQSVKSWRKCFDTLKIQPQIWHTHQN